MADDYGDIWNSIMLRATLDPLQCQAFTKDAFQQFCERREWSWLVKSGAFAPPQLYQTGTATATPDSAIVTGAGTAWTTAMVGRQFRFGIYTPIYTISAVNSATELVLSQPWVGQNTVTGGYLLYKCYYQTPADFREWLSLKDPQNNFKLHTNIQQPQLDYWDPQRSQNKTPRCAAFLDYGGSLYGSQGAVGQIMEVNGSGPAPVATTTFGYSYPSPASYIVTISTGGDPGDGSLAFTWFRISDGVATAVSNPQLVTDNDPINLSDGVQVYFPTAVSPYASGDVFVVNCSPSAVQPYNSPRYELWPHPMNNVYYYPFLYIARNPPFDETSPQLPPFIRKDVILELALEKCAMFPGTTEKPNPYFSLALAARHRASYERMAMDLELKDDSTAIRDFVYQDQTPWAPMPFMDGSWLRDHAIPSGSW